jgi:hypothetical protein
MKKLLLLCSFVGLCSGTAIAAENPWTGTWKLDPAASNFTGQTFTYSKGPGDMLHFEDGSSASFDFGLDGKEYKTWANRTTIWTATGENTWNHVTKADGKVLAKGQVALSADGNTLTMRLTRRRPDGKTFHEEDVFTRVSGTGGLIGTWRATKVVDPVAPQTFVISSPAPGMVHEEVPDMKASLEGPTDGSDLALKGPDLPPAMTIAFKPVTSTKMSYVIKINGKADSIGEQTIAADGRSFMDVSWSPGRDSEKSTAVYVKQ